MPHQIRNFHRLLEEELISFYGESFTSAMIFFRHRSGAPELCGSFCLFEGIQKQIIEICRCWKESREPKNIQISLKVNTDIQTHFVTSPHLQIWIWKSPPNIYDVDLLKYIMNFFSDKVSHYAETLKVNEVLYGFHMNYLIRDYLCQCLNSSSSNSADYWPLQKFINLVSKISMLQEEGVSARGAILFVSKNNKEKIDYSCSFSQTVYLFQRKLIRKLLTMTSSLEYGLVTDGEVIYGIARTDCSSSRITATLKGATGELTFDGKAIANLSRGEFVGSSPCPSPNFIERAINQARNFSEADSSLPTMLSHFADRMVEQSSGATVIIDFNRRTLKKKLGGHSVDTEMTLKDPAISHMAKIDGALLVDQEGRILAFGCLLDGPRLKSEYLSRGARFNSALRYTAKNKNCIAVVISQDGNCSVIFAGKPVESDKKFFLDELTFHTDQFDEFEKYILESGWKKN